MNDSLGAQASSLVRKLSEMLCGGTEIRAVLSAWPRTLSEATTALKSAGLTTKGMSTSDLDDTLLSRLMEQEWHPDIVLNLSDAYSGVKADEGLFNLESSCRLQSLVTLCEADEHLIINIEDQNYSFSANCNFLTALLMKEDSANSLPQVAKSIFFLTQTVSQGTVRDKRHLCELYWIMLLARSLEVLFRHYDIVERLFHLTTGLQEDIPLVVLEILSRILYAQKSNGSWDDNCKITAFGILALSSLSSLPYTQQLGIGPIIQSISLGKSFLLSNRTEWTKGSKLWADEVADSSDTLSEAYSIAAALVPHPRGAAPDMTVTIIQETLISDRLLLSMKKAGSIISRTPLFLEFDPFALHIAEIKACFFLRVLQRKPLDIFPQDSEGDKKSSFIIPLTLTACSALKGYTLSIATLHEMLKLSVLNFQLDEYMERVVEKHFSDDLNAVRVIIDQIFVVVSHRRDAMLASVSTKGEPDKLPALFDEQETANGVGTTLRRFVEYTSYHPAVLSSPHALQERLDYELKTCILAHLTHAEDNKRLRGQFNPLAQGGPPRDITGHSTITDVPVQYEKPGRSFYRWVRSTSADHTSCPFSFVFFNCLLYAEDEVLHPGQADSGILSSASTAYLAEDACRHLASLCRMYNDLGSMERDADECNLNSTNFPEFFSHLGNLPAKSTSIVSSAAKAQFLWIAEYERRGLITAMELLERELGNDQTMRSLWFFVDLTELYGQIYVMKDVGTRIQ
ncbi:hypothetical protein GGR55DRAFT_675709 [Xylaria sp. FL0064]|nr:hypothetical protein GGR55DRAFT_675709 [Xylaria sp. FL0064]